MKYNAIDELGEITRRRGVAYYYQLYNLLSVALVDGRIAPGSALPTETNLMERFGLSRNTVRMALARLELEKRVVRRRGSGTYARSVKQPQISADAVAEALQGNDAVDLQASSRLLRVQSSVTPDFIRRRDPQFGDKTLLVQRRHSFRGLPVVVSTSYVPTSLSSRLSRRQLADQTVAKALAAIGIAAKSAEQSTIALAADSFIARHLGIEVASAVLCIQRMIRDAQDRAIEHQSLTLHPDRCHVRTLLSMKQTQRGPRWFEIQSSHILKWL